jgi:hypothetical protein
MASAAVAVGVGPAAPAKDAVIKQDPANNITEYIYSKMGVNLHHQPNHPIGIIKQVRVVGHHAAVLSGSTPALLPALSAKPDKQPAEYPGEHSTHTATVVS